MEAIYVSVWDGGTEISTKCNFDPQTKNVTDVESADVDGLDSLDREYIILPDGTEIERKDFLLDGEEES